MPGAPCHAAQDHKITLDPVLIRESQVKGGKGGGGGRGLADSHDDLVVLVPGASGHKCILVHAHRSRV